MKLWLYALAMCQSMFCAIPFPCHAWDEKARDRMLLCLPLIGLEIGLVWWGLGWLCNVLKIGSLLRGLVICACPWLLTGFMHLDGFMDVTDAVRSYRSLERRREILKDSHVGSFAVIGFGLLLLAQFAAAASLPEKADLRILLFIPVVSRCCSVLAVMILPPMNTSQYAQRQKTMLSILLPLLLMAAAVACAVLLCGKAALALLGAAVGYGLALCRSYRSLQGMNGDISGYSLTLSGLTALAVLAFV